jgi:exopolysaccharide production protein ExoZ
VWRGEDDKMANVTDQTIPGTLRGSDLGPGERSGTAPSQLVRNARLQYLRGFAAVAVLVYHAAHYVEKVQGGQRLTAIFTDVWGAYGVAVFFVLSGYLMAQLSLRDDPRRFLLNRVLRIYPLFLIVVALAVIGYLVSGHGRRPDLIALTLIPAGPRDYMLGVEWTLLFEMTYYVVIALLVLSGLKAKLDWFFGVWLAVIVGLALTGTAPPSDGTPVLSKLFGQSTNSAFLLGFLLPRFINRSWVPSATVLCALAVPFAVLAYYTTDTTLLRWPTAISALFLVAAALKAEPVMAPGIAGRFGLRLGDASYALYLCHMPVIAISGNLVFRTTPDLLLWTAWTASALVVALLLGPLDLRIHAQLKRWADRLSPRVVARFAYGAIAVFSTVAIASEVGERLTQRAADAARAAYHSNKVETVPSVIAGLDSTMPLDDGRLVLRGYGIDSAAPDEDSHVMVEQNGKPIGFDRMRRMRPRIAIEAQKPELKSYRFGFSLVTFDRFSCANGPLTAKLILSDGRVVAIESPTLETICPAR